MFQTDHSFEANPLIKHRIQVEPEIRQLERTR